MLVETVKSGIFVDSKILEDWETHKLLDQGWHFVEFYRRDTKDYVQFRYDQDRNVATTTSRSRKSEITYGTRVIETMHDHLFEITKAESYLISNDTGEILAGYRDYRGTDGLTLFITRGLLNADLARAASCPDLPPFSDDPKYAYGRTIDLLRERQKPTGEKNGV